MDAINRYKNVRFVCIEFDDQTLSDFNTRFFSLRSARDFKVRYSYDEKVVIRETP